MAPRNRTLTQAERQLALSRMSDGNDSQGLASDVFGNLVMAGDFDGLINSKPELLVQLPPRDLAITDLSLLNGLTGIGGPGGMGGFVEEERKLEQERVKFAKAVQGQPKSEVDVAMYGHFGKAERPKLLENLKKEMRKSRKMWPHGTGSVVFVPLPEPYWPCSKPSSELETMLSKDLRTETHHRGKVLVVQVIADAMFDSSNLLTIVEDEDGETEWLRFYHPQRQLGKEAIPKDSFIAIKEPYYTADNNRTSWQIRIDHSSDIVRLASTSTLLPLTWRMKTSSVNTKTATECKDDENRALQAGTDVGFQQAVHCYTEGLACVKDDEAELKLDLFRNRAYCNLELGRYDAAHKDALSAVADGDITITPRSRDLHYKTYRRAALASYNLRKWAIAEACARTCIDLRYMGDNENVKAILTKLSARKREQNVGEYDFPSIISKLGTQPRVDVADFLARTVVKESPGRGRGLFAAEDISCGEVILVEKAAHIMFDNDKDFYVAFNYDASADKNYMNMGALWQSIVREVERNPSKLPDMLNLFDHGYAKDPEEGKVIDGQTVIDVFHLRELMAHNAHSSGTPSSTQAQKMLGFSSYTGDQNAGVWLRATMMNHSCVPNTCKSNIGDLLILRAIRPIKKGEEIFGQYRNESDFLQRQVALEGPWGFTCQCPLCTVERNDSQEVRGRRLKLVNKFKDLMTSSDQGIMDIRLAENLVEAVKVYEDVVDTYSDEYQSVPRIDLIDMEYTFIQMWMMFKPAKETLEMIVTMAQDMGWFLDLDMDEPSLMWRENCLLDQRLVSGLLIAAKLKEKQRKMKAKRELEAVSGGFYRTINGVDDGFEALLAFIENAMSLRPSEIDS